MAGENGGRPWKDPYRNFRFEVQDGGFRVAGFSKVTGLEQTVNVIEYREGGQNDTVRKMHGLTDFGEVTFERGASGNEDFVNWINEVFSLDGAPGEEFRKTEVVVTLLGKDNTPVKEYRLESVWPSGYEVGELDATANEVLIETLTLQHEGMKVVNLRPDEGE